MTLRADDQAIGQATTTHVKSAQRTVQILEILASGTGPIAFTELRREMAIPKSSLYALLNTLVDLAWVTVDARTGYYDIGPRSLRVGGAYLDRDPVVQAASPLLAHARNQLDDTVHLARLDGPDVVYLVSRESTHHLRSVSRIGRRQPAHTTSLGQILLAMQPPEQVAASLPKKLRALTPETITNRDELLELLDTVRRRGWAYERGENTPGLGCVAVAVPGKHPATDAVSCSVPLPRLTDQRVGEIVAALVGCAGEIGQSINEH